MYHKEIKKWQYNEKEKKKKKRRKGMENYDLTHERTLFSGRPWCSGLSISAR